MVVQLYNDTGCNLIYIMNVFDIKYNMNRIGKIACR